ncbi:MAG: aminodeoxychorismate synthase component I, partial [Verrucomicrobiae bacterium]|nr:aminodeoxychorismate synthase component I [Verrucomicrobiae bacterium]
FPARARRGFSLPQAFEHGVVAGFLGYDLGVHLEKLPAPAQPVLEHPDFWLGFYDVAIHFDLFEGSASLVSSGRNAGGPSSRDRALFRRDQFLDELESEPLHFPARSEPLSQWNPLVSKEEYFHQFGRIREYLRSGDIYQANLTHPFLSTSLPASPAEMYEALRQFNPAPYAAYLDGGDFQLLSSSPEEFLKFEGRGVRTRPIKGTCARLGRGVEDWECARALLEDPKNRAELLMITDLLRNDLGRLAVPGSVCVPELVRCEEYAEVYHLVSTITAELPRAAEPWEALRACFPGGSITGAPKLRAQQIIRECERYARGAYTGSIGYFAGGAGHWSIAIRTMLCAEGAATFSVGGAITADSTPESEYEETWDKASALLKVSGRSVAAEAIP